MLSGLASGCAVALMATSAWLIARAAQQPPVLYLMVAVTAVRAFGIGRGVLRYLERLVSHDAAFRVLGRLRETLVAHLALLAPAGLPLWRRGDVLARTVDDVDDAGDAFLRGLLPLAGALLVCGGHRRAVDAAPARGRPRARGVPGRRLRDRAVDHRAPGGPHRGGGRRPARPPHPARHRDDRRGAGTRRARRLRRPGSPSSTGSRRAPPGWRAGTARAAGAAAGLAVLAMGLAVWLAAWAGVPAVVEQDLNPVLLAVIVLTPLALTDTVQAVGVAASTLRRSSRGGAPPVRRARHPAGHRAAARRPGAASRAAPGVPLPTVRLHGVGARWPGARRGTRCRTSTWSSPPAARIVVLGPSGSGKSTLLAVLLGFLTPTAGTITIDGVDLAAMDPDEARTLFAWCDQRAYLFDSTLGRERPAGKALRHRRRGGGGARGGRRRRLAGARCRTGSRPGSASTAWPCPGGERQRVALARALLADRPVLLADEPAAHLDGATADQVTATILRPVPGRTVVLVTPPAG